MPSKGHNKIRLQGRRSMNSIHRISKILNSRLFVEAAIFRERLSEKQLYCIQYLS